MPKPTTVEAVTESGAPPSNAMSCAPAASMAAMPRRPSSAGTRQLIP
jgi:hypothetical protein